jgi:hypothetical protein
MGRESDSSRAAWFETHRCPLAHRCATNSNGTARGDAVPIVEA